MPDNSTSQYLLQRDGTSQADRQQAALDPTYVAVDERSIKDLLAFAQQYAKELKYFNLDNQALGDWSNFLSPDLDLDEVVAFLSAPEDFPAHKAAPFQRPHFVLFLTFLQLLQHAQDQLNTLTQRHLDFYYQQVLHMSRKAAVPDRVNILLAPATDVEQVNIPAGTQLNAGTDSLGQDLVYQTDRDIVVNQAQVERLSSVYAEKRVTGIHEAREPLTGDPALMAMLSIALGDPEPGDALPIYETPDGVAHDVDADFLYALQQLVNFVRDELYLEFFEFRDLMRLKQQRQQRDTAQPEWDEIQSILEQAGKTRTQDAAYQFEPIHADFAANLRDFEANLKKAVGDPSDFDTMFDGIREVNTIYDAYDKRVRTDVQKRITERLYLPAEQNTENAADTKNFTRLMQLKVQIDNEWQEINRILEKAGQTKRQRESYTLEVTDLTDFDTNLQTALDLDQGLDFSLAGDAYSDGIITIDAYYAAFLQVEGFFFLSAENFATMMSLIRQPTLSTQEWTKIEQFLTLAHQEKVYTARRTKLQDVREADGFEAMLNFALGEAADGDSPLDQLEAYLKKASDVQYLETVAQRVPNAPDSANAITATEWADVYRIVEIAQRNREGLSLPIAQKVEWLNLSPTADATTQSVTLGVANETDEPRWKTFGQEQAHLDPPASASVPTFAPTFGWALCSPLLALSQGKRKITLTVGFAPDQFHDEAIAALLPAGDDTPAPMSGPFQVQLSTEKGWVEPSTLHIQIGDYNTLSEITTQATADLKALQFQLELGEEVDPLLPPVIEDQLEDQQSIAAAQTAWPLLRLMLRQFWQADEPPANTANTGRYITHYLPFKELILVCTHVKVEVSGLSEFVIENDDGGLDATKPFEPFGTRPVVGSRLLLGHPEIMIKKLDRLDFDIEWMAAPKDMAVQYLNYDKPITNASFTVQVSLIDKRRPFLLPNDDVNDHHQLFPAVDDVSIVQTISLPVSAAIEQNHRGYHYERSTEPVVSQDLQDLADLGDLRTWDRYWRWELTPLDFQHQAYSAVATKKATQMSVAIANKKEGDPDIKVEDYQVNPPYTPKIKGMSLAYTSSVEIVMADYQTGLQTDQIFHIQPFGYNEIESTQPWFLPHYDNEGELYIGLREVQPPQNLAVLFQMAEGSANPDLDPVPIAWSYLSGNRWISLAQGNVLSDTTRGLINSGIIEFSLEPAEPNTLLPPQLYWIRAAIPQHAASVCDTVSIHTQAVSATFVDQDNAPAHFSQPLPAESITQIVERVPEIDTVQQPYTSYGGKMAEQDRQLYTRVSERLRHKQRALSMWDYERLILEQFPQIYKAKCLPAGVRSEQYGSNEIGEIGQVGEVDELNELNELGLVEMIVIPDIRNKLPFNPLEPKAPADLLADIKTYVSAYMPAFATLIVKNAYYIQVKVRFAVRFLPGYDEGFYAQQLNDELIRFLSPWAYEEGIDIVIGEKIYANMIINFVDERPYVDYVAELTLFRSDDGDNFRLVQPAGTDGYYVTTDQPDQILVTARRHEIDMITDLGYESETFEGINYMRLELDFRVN